MNSKIIKVVAGGGKTTQSLRVLENRPNGLYLAFTNSVVRDMKINGYVSKTIDSFFTSFIFPKFTTIIPLIANGCKVKYNGINNLNGFERGISNIKITNTGEIYNKNHKLPVTLWDSNENLYASKFTNQTFLKAIFGKEELRLNDYQREGLAMYILSNYKEKMLEFIETRFDYVIIDEAQDLKGYKEEFAKILYESNIKLIVLGDENQNILGGGTWFENLNADEKLTESFRCPEKNCKWIRENLNIDIYGKDEGKGGYIQIDMNEVEKYDDGKRTLLYSATSNNIKPIIDNWKGPGITIKSAKGSTIENDIVILGKTLNKKNLYTAITRTKSKIYSTITKIN